MYEDVDTTEASLDLVEEVINCLAVGDVSPDGDGRAAGGGDLLDNILGPLRWLEKVTTTVVPSAPSRAATAAPMPPDPPVTTATRWF